MVNDGRYYMFDAVYLDNTTSGGMIQIGELQVWINNVNICLLDGVKIINTKPYHGSDMWNYMRNNQYVDHPTGGLSSYTGGKLGIKFPQEYNIFDLQAIVWYGRQDGAGTQRNPGIKIKITKEKSNSSSTFGSNTDYTSYYTSIDDKELASFTAGNKYHHVVKGPAWDTIVNTKNMTEAAVDNEDLSNNILTSASYNQVTFFPMPNEYQVLLSTRSSSFTQPIGTLITTNYFVEKLNFDLKTTITYHHGLDENSNMISYLQFDDISDNIIMDMSGIPLSIFDETHIMGQMNGKYDEPRSVTLTAIQQ